MVKDLLKLRGIITVLNTPFTTTNQIDIEALRKNIRYAIRSGVAGFLVPAMASEVDRLTENERLTMVKTALDEIKGSIPVIGGASSPDRDTRLKMTRSLIDLGCEGILHSIPFTNEEQYRSEVELIAKYDPKFLMLQDYAFSAYGLPVSLITKLFQEIECFRALKIELVPAGLKYTEILKATEGKLHVSGGWAVMQLIEALDRGVHAFMPTGMHEIYTQIFSLYMNGKRNDAQKLFHQILPVLAFSNQHLDISIHFFKRLLWKQGIYLTPNVRQPILPFDDILQKNADELISIVLNLIQKLF